MTLVKLAAEFVAQPGITQQEGERFMRKFILIGSSLVGLLLAGGCATPGYTAAERNQLIARDMDYNGKQAVDDFDAVFLLQPASHLTVWNVQ